MTPRVSVVIPTRNRAGFLKVAAGSAFAQRAVDLEVIIVDEGSTDETSSLLDDLECRGVRVIRHDAPRGIAAARNAGIGAATAPWVAFLDDDDYWSPDKLRTQLDALEAAPAAAWCCVGSLVVGTGGEVRNVMLPAPVSDLLACSLRANVIPGGGSGVVASAELVRSVGGFDTNLRVLADWDMWIRLARVAPLAMVRTPLMAYMLHDGAMSSVSVGLMDELHAVLRKHADLRARHAVRGLPPGIVQWIAKRHWEMARRRLALRTVAQLRDPVTVAKFVAGRMLAGARVTVGQRLPKYRRWRLDIAGWQAPAQAALQEFARAAEI